MVGLPRVAASLGLVAALAALAVPAAASPPADAFCVILFEPSPDFRLVRVTVDEETTVEQRAALWPDVDLDGNGVVSPVEKDGWRWSQTQAFPRGDGLGNRSLMLWPDAPYTKSPAQAPVYATTWRQVGHVFHNIDYELPGQLTRVEELETQEVREYGFDLLDGKSSRFSLIGGADPGNASTGPRYEEQGRPVIEYVVVKAPKGWVVERIDGLTYDGPFLLMPDEREVDVPAFDTKAPYNITFLNKRLDEELGEIEGPAPVAVLTGLGLLAATAVRRRRQ